MAELKNYHRKNSSPIPESKADIRLSYDNTAFEDDSRVQEDHQRQPTSGTSEASTNRATSEAASWVAQDGVDGRPQHDVVEIEDEAREKAEDGDQMDCYTRAVSSLQNAVYGFFTENAEILWKLFYVLLLLGYTAYFVTAMVYRFGDEGSIRLLVITATVAAYLMYRMADYVLQRQGVTCDGLSRCFGVAWKFCQKIRLNVVLPVLVSVAFIVFIIVDVAVTRYKPNNLISAGGMVVFVFLFYVFSYNPAKVQWRPVVWGLLLQFIFAVLILRTTWGRATFSYLGDRITEFLKYTNAGAMFVFGDAYTQHFFAFSVLPVVVFFSACVSMLYYVGFMQFVIRNLGRFLAFCLGTSPAESINAAGNIFIGQSEAPLMIRPFLAEMTMSELHAVLTGGFATIAGSVMAAYILYKVPAEHLLSASVMSAPAALAMSKLFYPETEKVRNTAEQVYSMKRGAQRNIIEAASDGAGQAIRLVANIAVNLIAFVALLEFVNATLTWLGDRVGIDDPKLTFQLICSYLFWPLAFLMGVEENDRLAFGELVGTKTFLNEFVAYKDLSKYIGNKESLEQYLLNFTLGLPTHPTGVVNYTSGGIFLHDIGVLLEKGVMSERSTVVATYALCGFSNIASMGLMLGALGGMAPGRRSDISSIVLRAMIAGNVACFMTACIAGLLLD